MEVGHEQSHLNWHGCGKTSDHVQKGRGRRQVAALDSTQLSGNKQLDLKGPDGSRRQALGSEMSGQAQKDLVESWASTWHG